MSNFGYNNTANSNQENILAQYLRQFIPQQQTQQVESVEQVVQKSQHNNSSGMPYEINCQADIDYIEIDKSGRTQIFICQNEKRIYTRRYNHSKQKPDYKEYIEEEETKLSQKNDNNAGMSQIAEALVAVASRLECMHVEIQQLKNNEPEIIEAEPTPPPTKRRSNGQFKKKGES